MKLLFAVLLFAFCAVANFAQVTSVESDFEKNKTKYKLEKLSEGEDATSGYDYLVYKNKDEIVKIREIWSSSAVSTYRAEDYFFKDGKFVAYVKYTFAKKYYKTAIKGTNVPLKLVEKLYFSDSKLTSWIENGKTIPTNDKRWQEKENDTLERAKNQLEMYKLIKEGN
jgi:hypothetical protein